MAKKVTDMNSNDIARAISTVVQDKDLNAALGGNLQRLSKLITKLIEKAYQEGIEYGERFE
jgi:hypothetical protein